MKSMTRSRIRLLTENMESFNLYFVALYFASHAYVNVIELTLII